MILTSITIVGFKSFAKKVTIDLNHAVTGVVGPNGSGKSNVAEAIRFVLGEQSMKSMRTKVSTDLIFKGSHHLSQMSRASVSMKIDNSIKGDYTHSTPELAAFLQLDEIVIARDIYGDGSSEYSINGAVVRLKDVQELLALAGIGTSAHTIINQGEADRILLANSLERREILEDALGLRVYHLRIKESEKKLEKTESHLVEVNKRRAEIAPELKDLKKQVDIISKKQDEMQNLTDMWRVYAYRETSALDEMLKNINAIREEKLEQRLVDLETKLIALNAKNHSEVKIDDSTLNTLKHKLSETKHKERSISDEIYNNERRIRDIEYKLTNVNNATITISHDRASNLVSNIKEQIEYVNNNRDNNIIDKAISNINISLKHLEEMIDGGERVDVDALKNEMNNIKEALNNLKNIHRDILSSIATYENSILEESLRLQNLHNMAKMGNLEDENLKLNIASEIKDIKSRLYNFETLKTSYDDKNAAMNFMLAEMGNILNNKATVYKIGIDNAPALKSYIDMTQHALLRLIERSKIKIEEAGIMNSEIIIDDYNTLLKEEEFLRGEYEDIIKTKESLKQLIIDLRENLHKEFLSGLEKINFSFSNFFHQMFSGGTAKLVSEEIKSGTEEDEIVSLGIGINVNLPSKKVKDLNMLSGGERALTSIALIFAMSSISPPPFMVLDETDAALDENNARKYGDMINKLSQSSKLLVITHNRETMNRCDVLYGVTVGAEGCSKLLSIKFDVAQEWAK